eukprot:scaffold320181_cov32-Tisochrysis_lutea.AAC.2
MAAHQALARHVGVAQPQQPDDALPQACRGRPNARCSMGLCWDQKWRQKERTATHPVALHQRRQCIKPSTRCRPWRVCALFGTRRRLLQELSGVGRQGQQVVAQAGDPSARAVGQRHRGQKPWSALARAAAGGGRLQADAATS